MNIIVRVRFPGFQIRNVVQMRADGIKHSWKIDGSLDVFNVPGGILERREAHDGVDHEAELFPKSDRGADVVCRSQRQEQIFPGAEGLGAGEEALHGFEFAIGG